MSNADLADVSEEELEEGELVTIDEIDGNSELDGNSQNVPSTPDIEQRDNRKEERKQWDREPDRIEDVGYKPGTNTHRGRYPNKMFPTHRGRGRSPNNMFTAHRGRGRFLKNMFTTHRGRGGSPNKMFTTHRGRGRSPNKMFTTHRGGAGDLRKQLNNKKRDHGYLKDFERQRDFLQGNSERSYRDVRDITVLLQTEASSNTHRSTPNHVVTKPSAQKRKIDCPSGSFKYVKTSESTFRKSTASTSRDRPLLYENGEIVSENRKEESTPMDNATPMNGKNKQTSKKDKIPHESTADRVAKMGKDEKKNLLKVVMDIVYSTTGEEITFDDILIKLSASKCTNILKTSKKNAKLLRLLLKEKYDNTLVKITKRSIKKPRVDVEICQKYTGNVRNVDHKCIELHICKFYLIHDCPNQDCQFGHNLRTQHNQDVLENFNMSSLDDEDIRRICKDLNNINPSTIPIVCKFYNNEGSCKKGKCPYLHVCKYFMDDQCKFGSGCKRSHNLKDPQPSAILIKHGFDCDYHDNIALKGLMQKAKRKTVKSSPHGMPSHQIRNYEVAAGCNKTAVAYLQSPTAPESDSSNFTDDKDIFNVMHTDNERNSDSAERDQPLEELSELCRSRRDAHVCISRSESSPKRYFDFIPLDCKNVVEDLNANDVSFGDTTEVHKHEEEGNQDHVVLVAIKTEPTDVQGNDGFELAELQETAQKRELDKSIAILSLGNIHDVDHKTMGLSIKSEPLSPGAIDTHAPAQQMSNESDKCTHMATSFEDYNSNTIRTMSAVLPTETQPLSLVDETEKTTNDQTPILAIEQDIDTDHKEIDVNGETSKVQKAVSRDISSPAAEKRNDEFKISGKLVNQRTCTSSCI